MITWRIEPHETLYYDMNRREAWIHILKPHVPLKVWTDSLAAVFIQDDDFVVEFYGNRQLRFPKSEWLSDAMIARICLEA